MYQIMHGGKRPGAGKPKGAKNLRTVECYDLAEKLGINPFEILLLFSANRWKELGYESATCMRFSKSGEAFEVDRIEPSDRIAAANAACKYLFPTRKAVELTDSDGNNPFQTFAEMVKQLADGSKIGA